MRAIGIEIRTRETPVATWARPPKKIYLPCDAAERATDDSHAHISCRVAIDLKILVSRMNISD